MKYDKLGSSKRGASEICLGSMTWGEQNSEDDAHRQLE
jgi:aryl-alcohol dehydrogenase-like predicted oxidoreductase